jgi:hypothetical protein
LQDISQKGAKIRASFVRSGDEVTLCLAGLEPRKALVRWTRLGAAGLNFVRPFGFDELGEWVIAQQLRDSSDTFDKKASRPHDERIR